MKKKSLLLTVLICLSPQISVATEAQSRAHFILDFLSATEMFKFSKDMVNILIENKNMVLFGALTAILGIVIYNKYGNSEAKKSDATDNSDTSSEIKLTPEITAALLKKPTTNQSTSIIKEEEDITIDGLKLLTQAYNQNKQLTGCPATTTASSPTIPTTTSTTSTKPIQQSEQQKQPIKTKWYPIRIENKYSTIVYTDHQDKTQAKIHRKMFTNAVDIFGYAKFNEDQSNIVIQSDRHNTEKLLNNFLVRSSGTGSQKGARRYTDLTNSVLGSIHGPLLYALCQYEQKKQEKPTSIKITLEPSAASQGLVWQCLPTTPFEANVQIECT